MSVETEQDLRDSAIRQFSVFMENKAGRLLDLVKLLGDSQVHIVALTILDSIDASIVRLVVDDPARARGVLLEHTIAFTESTLVVVELPSSAEDLSSVLSALLQAECNIYFSYSFLTRPRGKAALAMHVDDNDIAMSVLAQNQFKILSQKDISR